MKERDSEAAATTYHCVPNHHQLAANVKATAGPALHVQGDALIHDVMHRQADGQIQPWHHPLIAALNPIPITRPPEFAIGFLGIRTRVDFERDMPGFSPPSAPIVTPSRPGFDEEYFEWIDVFEAVAEKQGDFVMAEVGAGFGRWLVRGAVAARVGGRAFRGIAVEAEPDHFRWIRQHCSDNGVSIEDLDLVWAAIDSEPGFVPFSAGRASAWYGQGIRAASSQPFPSAAERKRLRARSALGRPPVMPSEGTIWVPRVTLTDVIAPYPRIDLVDIDVQGMELAVLQSAIDDLDARVRRVHVGTHSRPIERGLRALFTRHGWEGVCDYPSHARVNTPYGDVDFADGVQTWINPRLDPSREDDRTNHETIAAHANDGGRVKRGPSRTDALAAEVKTLEHQVKRLRQKNEDLKEKLARTRRKLAGRAATADASETS